MKLIKGSLQNRATINKKGLLFSAKSVPLRSEKLEYLSIKVCLELKPDNGNRKRRRVLRKYLCIGGLKNRDSRKPRLWTKSLKNVHTQALIWGGKVKF